MQTGLALIVVGFLAGCAQLSAHVPGLTWRVGSPKVLAVDAATAPGWSRSTVELEGAMEDAATKRICSGSLEVTTNAPAVIEVRGAPRVVRLRVGDAEGFAVRTSDGRELCVPSTSSEGGLYVGSLTVALGVGRHQLYLRPFSNRQMTVELSPAFLPSDAQLAAWFDAYPHGKGWTRLAVHKTPMGKPLYLPVQKEYCYHFFLIHRPAARTGGVTQIVRFEPRVYADDDDESGVGWTAHYHGFCAEEPSKVKLRSFYDDDQPPKPGDQLEVRVRRSKMEPLRKHDERCDPCRELYRRCRQTNSPLCGDDWQRCLRVEHLSKKMCGAADDDW